jgi:hypothetical protein
VSGALRRILLVPLAFALGAPTGAGCARGWGAAAAPGTTPLGEALRPAFLADAVARAGGGHMHVVARFAVGEGAPDDGVTTTTDVWIDGARNWRVVETNDRDGGREVVRVGRELFVALRYGKMIRRVAEEPEPTRILGDALGAPWAGWEIAAPWAALARSDGRVGAAQVTSYRITRAAARTDVPSAATTGLRAWRADAVVTALDGNAGVDVATGALTNIDLSAKFTARRDGRDGDQGDQGNQVMGAIEIHGALTDIGRVDAVARPTFEDLALRQRIVPEQRELLGGLPVTHPLPAPPPKPGAHAVAPANDANARPGRARPGLASPKAPTATPSMSPNPALKGHPN